MFENPLTTPSTKKIAGIFLTLILLFLPVTLLAEEKEFELQVYLTKKQALEKSFPGADEVVKEKKWLTKEQGEKIAELSQQKVDEKRITWYIGKKAGQAMGYMWIDNVIGKSYPITYMVVLNVDGTVRDVEIMVYREPRGWEVRYPSFLDQFLGKNSDSDFREINSITGATLSVRGITKGVTKAVSAYKVLYLEEQKAGE
jgi:Na+-translocating ferredoxin:NAD+ oxidoreductase RnfG subunit